MSGKLYIVPTPIGNLKDITLRALEVLEGADVILAEDTRVSGKLLKHFGIDTPVSAFHQHNEHKRLESVMDMLEAGKRVAVITDAGTPGISDPGFLVVREALRRGIPVEVLPGPTALIPALVASGLPSERFVFEGFLPVKKGRQTRLTRLEDETRTMIFYEAPHRLVKTLHALADHLGPDRPAAVVRELTKKFEEIRRGTLSELAAHYESRPPKGEIVIVVGGKPKK
ncbi:MAG: 16S rRNA (cytidine(1402)-2'-O)-methyltransferase [Chlorobi bacterium]|nr:16S rRNA (cytidine(1402)-2'-O)-methyltransferase [Chlorobiota bacterium]